MAKELFTERSKPARMSHYFIPCEQAGTQKARPKQRVKPVDVSEMKTAIAQTRQDANINDHGRTSCCRLLKDMTISVVSFVGSIVGQGVVGIGCLFAIPYIASTKLVTRCFPELMMTGSKRFWCSFGGVFGLFTYIAAEASSSIAKLPKTLWRVMSRDQQQQQLLQMVGSLDEVIEEQSKRRKSLDLGQTVGEIITYGQDLHNNPHTSS